MGDRATRLASGKRRAFQHLRQATVRNVEAWTVADCMKWFKSQGFEEFSLDFYHNGFSGPELLRIDERTFPTMWIRQPARCIELAEAIQKLRLRELGLGSDYAAEEVVQANTLQESRQRPSIRRQKTFDEDPVYGESGEIMMFSS